MEAEDTRPSLLLRVRDPSDQDSWREFDTKYRHLILRYCARRGLQISDAEDIRQAVMISLTSRLPAFEYSPERGRFRDYLGRSVRHAVARHFRGQKPEPAGLEVEEEPAGSEDPRLTDLWDREWVLHHYRLALAHVRLTVDEQSVEVFEQLLRGKGVSQVAFDFGLKRDAVYKIKQRMRDRLQERIQQQIGDEQMPSPAKH